jgi:hypothetical protein
VTLVPLLSVDDLCKAMQQVLEDHLPALAASRGLQPITSWDQLPSPDALTRANLPAGAITSPGLTALPARRSGGHDATWRIAVGVYERGRDHTETAAKVRDWAAVIRQTVLHHPTLGGVASGVVWIGEEYAERPERSSARTLGGCAVAFDVTARNVIDSEPYVPPDSPGGGDQPVVTSTHRTVTVRRPSTEE